MAGNIVPVHVLSATEILSFSVSRVWNAITRIN